MKITIILGAALLISSCASDKGGQKLYSSSEVGRAISIKSCTVISSRSVIIREQSSGNQGETIGFFAGSISSRNGKPLSGLVAGLVGGAIGRQVSDSLHERDGVEYTVILKNGDEKQLVQDITDNELILASGDACRLQTSGSQNRVLAAKSYPSTVNRPKSVGFN